jgi:hypothetical protein
MGITITDSRAIVCEAPCQADRERASRNGFLILITMRSSNHCDDRSTLPITTYWLRYVSNHFHCTSSPTWSAFTEADN